MKPEIISKLENYIASELLKNPGQKIAPDEPLISGGMVDSFSLVDLALYVEENFAVRIDDTELNADSFDTLDELAGLIESRL